MLQEVPLPFTPTVAHCITWSSDGELAVAAGEFVHILVCFNHAGICGSNTDLSKIPRRRQLQIERARDAWARVHIRVNLFTWAEWPEQGPLETARFSIGEEQSPSTVVALAWSSPGLAKNKRPVLAVLTSNHLLSLWASNSDMKNPASWGRVFIINTTVRRSLELLPANAPSRLQSESLEKPHLLRIRCMAWAPLLDANDVRPFDDSSRVSRMEFDQDQSTGHDASTVNLEAQSLPAEISLTMETQLLAIANDCGQVYVVRVSSPYTNYSNLWGADMIAQYSSPNPPSLASLVSQESQDDDHINTVLPSVQLSESKIVARPSLLAVAMSKRNYVEDVLWSPWRTEQSGGMLAGTLTTRREGVFSHHTCLVGVVDGMIECRFEDADMDPSDPQNPGSSAAVWFQSVRFVLFSDGLY